MRLPSLNALRAFEAAARHGSFARAASELCVSEGAVSRHVKLLEEELGVALFRRLTRKVELTEQGRELLTVAGNAFASIASGVARLSSPRTGLKIACDQTLSIRWLVPRLERFREKHPDVSVQLTAEYVDSEELIAKDFDIRFGGCEAPAGFREEWILPSALTPACSPRLGANGTPLRTPRDIANFTILHPTMDRRDWRNWAQVFGQSAIDVKSGQTFSSLDMAIRAAVLGEGIVMGDLIFMREELLSGDLVLPFPDLVLRSAIEDYKFYCREESWGDPRVLAFYNWLIEERNAFNP